MSLEKGTHVRTALAQFLEEVPATGGGGWANA